MRLESLRVESGTNAGSWYFGTLTISREISQGYKGGGVFRDIEVGRGVLRAAVQGAFGAEAHAGNKERG